jgi:glycosyltransferase involved in cell wall biosynthesis
MRRTRVITIVTPTYNAERFIRQTIDSVRRQTLTQWEMIVVDDGSTDGAIDIVRECAAADPRVRLVIQPNAGVAQARNRGIAALSASTRYVMFLDHDDLLLPDALATLARALDDNQSHVAVHGVAQSIDERGAAQELEQAELFGDGYARFVLTSHGHRRVSSDQPTTLEMLALACCIPTPGAGLIRRSALDAIGPFDPSVVSSDDWDVWIRLSRLGSIGFVPTIVMQWRSHSSNSSRKWHSMSKSELKVRKKWEMSRQLTSYQRDLFRRSYFYTLGIDARNKLQYAVYCARGREFNAAFRQLSRASRLYFAYLGGHLVPSFRVGTYYNPYKR